MTVTLGITFVASVKQENLHHAKAPSGESSAHRRQNGGNILEVERKKNTGTQKGCCMLAIKQLGCSPKSHLAALLDLVASARPTESLLNYIQPLGWHS